MKVSKANIDKVDSYIFRGGERPKDFKTRFYMATVFERQREIMENVTLYMPKDRSLGVHIDNLRAVTIAERMKPWRLSGALEVVKWIKANREYMELYRTFVLLNLIENDWETFLSLIPDTYEVDMTIPKRQRQTVRIGKAMI